MAIAGSLEIQMSASIARLQSDMTQAKGIVTGTARHIEGAVATMNGALGTLGIGIGVGYFVSLIKGSIDAADHLQDLSKTTSIAVEQLAGLRVAAKQSGGDLDSIAASINKLSVNMGKDAEKFAALGVSAKDPLKAFQQLSDIYVKLEDPQQRAAVMAAALGKSWAGAAPLLAEGGKRIGEIVEQGAKLSGITPELTKQADDLNDKLVLLTGTGGLLTRMVGPLLPLLNSLADDMLDVGEKTSGTSSSFSILAETLRPMIVLAGNFAYVWRTVGISAAGSWEQMAGLKNGGIAGFLAARAIVKKVLEDERAAHDAWEAKTMAAGTSGAKETGHETPPMDRPGDAGYAARAAAFIKEAKAVTETESAYKAMHKTLSEMLLTERERTEVNKLQLALDAMTAKKRAELTSGEESALKVLAAKVDLIKANKVALEAYVKLMEFDLDQQKEVDEFMAARAKVQGDAILATSKQIDQMEFETKLIGKTNVEREQAIFLRQAEIDKIDEATIARGKEAIAASNATKEVNTAQVDMWKSVESAGHQAFLSIFDTSKGVLERIRAMLKTHLIDILYQMTVKKWVFNIVASVSGAGVAQQAIGSTASGMSGLSNLSSIGNLFSTGGGALGSSAAYAAVVPGLTSFGAGSQAAMLAAQTGGFGAAGLSATASAGGGAAAAGIATAVPYIAAAVAAYYVGKGLGLWGGKGTYATTTGYRLQGEIGAGGGFQGTSYGLAENAGTKYSDVLPASMVGVLRDPLQTAVVNLATEMRGIAEKLKLDTGAFDAAKYTVDAQAASTADTITAAFAQVAEQMAESLIPNIRDLQLANESLTQTFGRLAAAQLALDAQRRVMDIQLMEALGNATGALAAKREDELKALDPALHALQRQIYAAQDLANAANDASGAVSTLATLLGDTKSAIDDQINASRSASQGARQAADSYRQITAALADAAAKIGGGGRSGAAGRLGALFGTAMTGDAAALSGLPQAGQDFLAASHATSRTALDFARDQAKVVGMLNQAQLVSTAMVDWNEYQATLLETQVGVLEAIKAQLALPSPDAAILTQQMGMLGTIADLLRQQTVQIVSGNGMQAVLMQDQAGKIVLANALTVDQTGQVMLGNSWLSQQSGLLAAGNATLGAQTNTIAAASAVAQAQSSQLIGGIGAGNATLGAQTNTIAAASAVAQAQSSQLIGGIGAGNAGQGAIQSLLNGQTVQIVDGNLIQRNQSGLIVSSNALLLDQAGKIAFGNALVGTQTNQIITGNSIQDAVRNISAVDTGISEEMLRALVVGGAMQGGSLQGVLGANLATVALLQQLLMMTAQLVAVDAAAAAIAAQRVIDDASAAASAAAASAAIAAQRAIDAAAASAAAAIEAAKVAGTLPISWTDPDDGQDRRYPRRYSENARGGLATGWSLVGEQGPEMVDFSRPGRVYTAQQTAGMMGGANEDLVAEVRALRAQIEKMQQDTRKTANILTMVTQDGQSIQTTVAA